VKAPVRRWRRRADEVAAARSRELDAILDGGTTDPPGSGPFATERAAARALARALPLPADEPTQALVTVRAGLAARQASRRAAQARARSTLRIGSAAALALVVMLAFATSSQPGRLPVSPAVAAVEDEAIDELAVLDQAMAEVRVSVEVGDRESAQVKSQAVADSVNKARRAAGRLPPGNPVRDKVLTQTFDQVAELHVLATRLQIEVPPLVNAESPASSPAPPATTAPPASTATTAPPAPTATTTSAPSSTAPPTTPSTTAPTTAPPTTVVAPTTTTTRPPVTVPVTAPTTTTTLPPPTTTTTLPPPTTTTTVPAPTTTTTTTTVPAPTTTTTTTVVPAPTTTTTTTRP